MKKFIKKLDIKKIKKDLKKFKIKKFLDVKNFDRKQLDFWIASLRLAMTRFLFLFFLDSCLRRNDNFFLSGSQLSLG